MSFEMGHPYAKLEGREITSEPVAAPNQQPRLNDDELLELNVARAPGVSEDYARREAQRGAEETWELEDAIARPVAPPVEASPTPSPELEDLIRRV